MTTIYNGYAPGEQRTRTMRPRKGDLGHSLVTMVTTRRGDAFSFHTKGICECGQEFGTKGNRDSIFYRHSAHVRTATNGKAS